MKKRVIIIAFIVLLLGVGILVYFGQRNARLKDLYYSGTIEAIQSELAFQVSGRVVNIPVDEGQPVEENQILAELDGSEFLANRDQVKANLEASKRDLQQLELNLELLEKNLPLEVKRAQAGVDALRAMLNEAESGFRRQDVEKGRLTLLAAEASKEVARKDKERFDKLFKDKIVSEKERDMISLQFENALRDYERARESFAQLSEGFRKEDIETAKARLSEGESLLNQANSNLKKIEITKKAVEGARARVKAAEAVCNLTETRLSYTQLKAPFNGIIVSRNIEHGEVVTPGQDVFSLSDLSTVELKIFVDETEIGKVKPGQMAEIKVDTFPDKVFKGKVSFISPDGEFTPKIIQTHKERVKLVYLVKVLIPNPEYHLKSGMPADAWLQ